MAVEEWVSELIPFPGVTLDHYSLHIPNYGHLPCCSRRISLI